MSLRCKLLAAVFVGLSVSWVSARAVEAGPWKAVLPEAEFTRIMKAESKVALDVLAKVESQKDDAAKKKLETKARVAAVMAAGYAQTQMIGNPAKAQQLAGTRDLAVSTAKAITDGKLADAKKLAADLSQMDKGIAGANTEPVDLHKHFELADLMTQFKPERSGVGRDFEAAIKAVVNKRGAGPMPAKMLADGADAAWRTAVIAQFTEVMWTEPDAGKKTKSEWVRLSRDMGTLAVEAAKLAGTAKPDSAAVKALFKKLDDNCIHCHTTFRD